MKIDFCVQQYCQPIFGDLDVGDCFVDIDEIWMKTKFVDRVLTDEKEINAVNLETGEYGLYDESDFITPIKCKITEDWDNLILWRTRAVRHSAQKSLCPPRYFCKNCLLQFQGECGIIILFQGKREIEKGD